MDRCWAAALGNCSDKISGEHIISNVIIDTKITVSGFSWCRESPKTIGSNSFVSNFLCTKHNNMLSTADSEIGNFVDVIDRFSKTNDKFRHHGFTRSQIPVIQDLNGLLLERWFIKTLINVNLIGDKEAVVKFERILPVLYLNERFDSPFGLSFMMSEKQDVVSTNGIDLIPLFNYVDKIKELAGALFKFMGYTIVILLPCSDHPFIDNKFRISEKELKKFDIEPSDLDWHIAEIRQIDLNKKHREVKTQSIIFNWV